MTDLDVYQPPAQPGQYHPGLAVTPEQAKALDEQVRLCTKAVLKPGTDFGIIPGTNGEQSLWRPGAQKLLQWFRLGYTCERVDLERDDQGRKHGITYRCEVKRRHPDGSYETLATCEGTADYDEPKFYQPAEQVQAKAEARERMWARKDGRVANPEKWKHLGEYRADWNALMKRSQKRAIVGAVVDATAAGGLFTDREEDDTPAPQEDDGPTWYEQALEAAHTFTTRDEGADLYRDAARAHREGQCTRRQQDHIQNTVRQRVEKFKNAVVVDVEDIAHATYTDAGPGRADDQDSEPPGADPDPTSRARQEATESPGGEDAPARDAGTGEVDYDTPGTVSRAQLTAIWTILTSVYGFGRDEKDQARAVCAHVTGHPVDSTARMTRNEAKTVLDALASWQDTAAGHGVKAREFLIELLATADKEGDSDE